jgi:hypothetical protein
LYLRPEGQQGLQTTARAGTVVGDEHFALHDRFILVVFGFTPDSVHVTQSVPEKGSAVIGWTRVPHTQKDRLFGGPSQHSQYAI